MLTEKQKSELIERALSDFWATPETQRPQIIAKVEAGLNSRDFREACQVMIGPLRNAQKKALAAKEAQTRAIAEPMEYRMPSVADAAKAAVPILTFVSVLAVGGAVVSIIISFAVGIGKGIEAAAVGMGAYIVPGLCFVGVLALLASFLRANREADAVAETERQPKQEIIQIVRNW